ncbi:MAG TPA: hypothetical protein VGH79_00890 [Gaiellaceae bacterium]
MESGLAEWRSTEPSAWRVTLTSGSVVEVWADGVQELDEHVVFSSLVDVERRPEDWVGILIMGETPTNPLRFLAAVARFPRHEVADFSSI